MLIQRTIQTDLIRLAGQYPVVTIVGPRQSGKSTLTRMSFPDKPYVSLEQLSLRDFALSDPVGFLDTHASSERGHSSERGQALKIESIIT